MVLCLKVQSHHNITIHNEILVFVAPIHAGRKHLAAVNDRDRTVLCCDHIMSLDNRIVLRQLSNAMLILDNMEQFT